MTKLNTGSENTGRASADYSVEEILGMEVARTSRLWRAKLDERFRPLGLTQARWVVLFHLDRGCEGMTQKDLAAEVGVEAPTLVRTLDLIEERNLIARRPAPNDRRAKTVHLTTSGRRMLEEMYRAAKDLRADLLAGIPQEQMAVCLDVLTRIRAACEAIPPLGRGAGLREEEEKVAAQ
jgi:MarR family transcriptional regulator for hemolysin